MVRREANYYIGNNLKNKGDYTEAFSYYKKCIEDSKKIDEDKASGFRINATLYSGTIMETKGKYDEAKKYYNAVLNMREFNNSHTLAETYLARIDKLEKNSK
jgi:TolA-binding protein